ncbi:hypothetical protein Avbf_05361, partial [Armadillidium vulgare]
MVLREINHLKLLECISIMGGLQPLNIVQIYKVWLNKGAIDVENYTDSKVSFLDRAAALSIQLRQMANTELGVTNLQDIFNSLRYVTVKKDEEKELTK